MGIIGDIWATISAPSRTEANRRRNVRAALKKGDLEAATIYKQGMFASGWRAMGFEKGPDGLYARVRPGVSFDEARRGVEEVSKKPEKPNFSVPPEFGHIPGND